MFRSSLAIITFMFAAASAPSALAQCDCSSSRGGGYDAAQESGVRILRGAVPSNFNAAAAAGQRHALANERAAFAAASRQRANQQRTRQQALTRAPQSQSYFDRPRSYRPAYSTLGRVYAVGGGQRLGNRSVRGSGARKRGATRTSSISFARRIRG